MPEGKAAKPVPDAVVTVHLTELEVGLDTVMEFHGTGRITPTDSLLFSIQTLADMLKGRLEEKKCNCDWCTMKMRIANTVLTAVEAGYGGTLVRNSDDPEDKGVRH